MITKINQRIKELRSEKAEWINKPFDTEGQRENYLSKIRSINSKLNELNNLLK